MIHKLNQENQERRQDIRSLESRLGDYQTNLLPILTERLRLLDKRVRNESLACSGSEWYYFRQKCYYFSRLLAALSWSEAQSFCKRFGGQLAIIRDEETNDFLTETIGNRRVHVWIGLTGADTDGTWKWVDKTSVDYNNWRYGEPTDHRSLQMCACLTDGLWDHYGCSDLNYFICESNVGFLKDEDSD
ncbi:asialoglycoprotein receptor 2-like [Ptychodera flava]|uniref:asialoglycoprotein receptor 2-like n=1 Tax=Ptychodera flava TaxID=63121 RepID=UPI00396A4E56